MRFPAGKLFFLLVFTSTLFTQTVIADELSDAVEADYDRHLGVLFEHFHRNPELSLMETRTAARLAEELRAAGFEVTEGVGGTGVVAIMENGPGIRWNL